MKLRLPVGILCVQGLGAFPVTFVDQRAEFVHEGLRQFAHYSLPIASGGGKTAIYSAGGQSCVRPSYDGHGAESEGSV